MPETEREKVQFTLRIDADLHSKLTERVRAKEDSGDKSASLNSEIGEIVQAHFDAKGVEGRVGPLLPRNLTEEEIALIRDLLAIWRAGEPHAREAITAILALPTLKKVRI